MKLYLGSYRIADVEELQKLLPAKPSEVRTAIIPNAGDYYADRARTFKINQKVEVLSEYGFKPNVVDLRDYDQASLEAKLKEYDFIWVGGGNTFCLRYEMQKSGFDQIIKNLLEQGLVYGGESAGAIVIGPSLKGVEYGDEPEFAEKQIYDGLGVVPQIVIPHADNAEFGDAVVKMLEHHQSNPDLITINDNQAVIIDGDEVRVVTATT